MKLSVEIKTVAHKSVLCWLATASDENIPNVSPKEVFAVYGDDMVIIANIASPQSVRNIKHNANVCVSFIDILVQKGYQLKGKARIIGAKDAEFPPMEKILMKMTGGKFPFSTLTAITIEQSKPIIAPRYSLYPETTEKEQIVSAKKRYGF
ncbi:MAG: pyridoxamine 5'-phosphate oxidase family protein [Bacteroidota bacterium]